VGLVAAGQVFEQGPMVREALVPGGPLGGGRGVHPTQTAAIALYESLGYQCWGTHPAYARVDGRVISGRYYHKRLDQRQD
jgi:hypothetical protein